MEHMIICPECGSYFNEEEIKFNLADIVATEFFLTSEDRKDDAPVQALRKSGFTFMVDRQFLINYANGEGIYVQTRDDVSGKLIEISIKRDTAVRVLLQKLNSRNVEGRWFADYCCNPGQTPLQSDQLDLIRMAFFPKLESTAIRTVNTYMNNFNNFQGINFSIMIHIVENGIDCLQWHHITTSGRSIGSCVCGCEIPDCFAESKITPVLFYGTHQVGKSSLITAMQSMVAGNKTIKKKKYSITLNPPANSEERSIYEDNLRKYQDCAPPNKTDKNKAPLCSLKVKTDEKTAAVTTIEDEKTATIPLIDICGESVAKIENNKWIINPAYELPDSGIKRLCKRAEYLIFCISPEMMFFNGEPLVTIADDTAKNNMQMQLTILSDAYNNIRGERLKTVIVLLTKFDMIYTEENTANADTLQEVVEQYRNSAKIGDFEKVQDVLNNISIDEISRRTKEVLGRYMDCQGISFTNFFENIESNEKVKVLYLPVSACGEPTEDNPKQFSTLLVSLPLTAILTEEFGG